MFATPRPGPMLDPELGFASGTQVHTQAGLKPIEDIRVGDWVLSHPESPAPPRRRRQLSEYQYRPVTRTSSTNVASLVRITVQNLADGLESTLLVAPGQAIWTQPLGWLAASQVRAGQALVLSFNGNALVQQVQAIDQPARVHGLEVADCPTCYVAPLGVWVHCRPEVVLPTRPANELPPALDFGKPQVLMQIADYYNDTLAEPEAPPAAAPTLAQQMRAAAEKLRGACQDQMKLTLDYDEAGVGWMADYIDRARLRASDDKSRQNSIHLIGAFLGECTIRCLGGRWSTHEGMSCVVLNEGGAVFPHNKVTKQFDNGSEGGDSILGFYQVNKVFNETMFSKPLTPLQVRLLGHAGDSERCIFVPVTSGTIVAWVQVEEVRGGRTLVLWSPPDQDYTESIFLSDVKCFYVCDSAGKLLHADWIRQADWGTLPPDILRQLQSTVASDTSITLGQLARGRQFVEVSHGASDKPADEHHGFSTTLKNISSRKIRITRFGGFKAAETAWQLASVTGDFYTAEHFREWYEQTSEWLLPGETVCDAGNWGTAPVLWAYWGVTDTGESFVAGEVLEKPIASSEGSTGAHFVEPVKPQPEMAAIMAKLRASYELRQQRMSAISLEFLIGPRPPWLTEADGLAEFFHQQPMLLAEGRIVWGALIQANTLLFKPGESNCPGLLVHSDDPYFDDRPLELRLIGHTFFSFKHTEPTDPELKEVARLVTDELDRSMGFELPTVFSSKRLCSATFMVFRKHVPNGVLSSGLFPILTHPSTRAVMMVPFEFWPIELIVLWKENQL